MGIMVHSLLIMGNAGFIPSAVGFLNRMPKPDLYLKAKTLKPKALNPKAFKPYEPAKPEVHGGPWHTPGRGRGCDSKGSP